MEERRQHSLGSWARTFDDGRSPNGGGNLYFVRPGGYPPRPFIPDERRLK